MFSATKINSCISSFFFSVFRYVFGVLYIIFRVQNNYEIAVKVFNKRTGSDQTVMMFRIGIIHYIGVLTLSSLLSCYSVQAVTAFDPCDPLQANVTAHSVFREKMILMIQEMKVPPIWFITPLRYVNCSRRGINRIPQSIASNVQHLDLSSNALDRVETKDLVKYKDLQILILYSNCIGNSRHRANYCYGLRGAYDKHAFKSLLNLCYLDVGGNNFLNFPPNLPSR